MKTESDNTKLLRFISRRFYRHRTRRCCVDRAADLRWQLTYGGVSLFKWCSRVCVRRGISTPGDIPKQFGDIALARFSFTMDALQALRIEPSTFFVAPRAWCADKHLALVFAVGVLTCDARRTRRGEGYWPAIRATTGTAR